MTEMTFNDFWADAYTNIVEGPVDFSSLSSKEIAEEMHYTILTHLINRIRDDVSDLEEFKKILEIMIGA